MLLRVVATVKLPAGNAAHRVALGASSDKQTRQVF
jgi:hypothetical protein